MPTSRTLPLAAVRRPPEGDQAYCFRVEDWQGNRHAAASRPRGGKRLEVLKLEMRKLGSEEAGAPGRRDRGREDRHQVTPPLSMTARQCDSNAHTRSDKTHDAPQPSAPARGCCSRTLAGACGLGTGRLFVATHSLLRGNRPGPPGAARAPSWHPGVVEKLPAPAVPALGRAGNLARPQSPTAPSFYCRRSVGEPATSPRMLCVFIRGLTPPARLRIAASREVEVGEGSETGQAAWRQSAVCGTGSRFWGKHGELAGDHCPRRLPRGTRRGRGVHGLRGSPGFAQGAITEKAWTPSNIHTVVTPHTATVHISINNRSPERKAARR